MARRKSPATTAHRPHCMPVALPRLDNEPPFVRRRVRVPREPPSRALDASFSAFFVFRPFLSFSRFNLIIPSNVSFNLVSLFLFSTIQFRYTLPILSRIFILDGSSIIYSLLWNVINFFRSFFFFQLLDVLLASVFKACAFNLSRNSSCLILSRLLFLIIRALLSLVLKFLWLFFL